MAKLADQAGVSLATIRDVESGRRQPSLTTCGTFGAVLGMSPEGIDECKATMERLLAKGRQVVKRTMGK
jgi:DNA-binding XRE family transcriptional regulator